MTDAIPAQTRRGALAVALAAAGAASLAAPAGAAEPVALDPHTGGPHDFDFLVGRWTVRHRWLRSRLAGDTEWIECDGTMTLWPTMGGEANIDDNLINRPDGAYRAMSIRAYDPKTRQWSIWWVDGRGPSGPIDPPVRGGFKDGTGVFLSDSVINGKPIICRYIWSGISPETAHWEQAFSPDGGKTWETNWRMAFTRVG